MHSKGLLAAAIVLVVAIAGGVYVVHGDAQAARLLKTFADNIPADPQLAEYAQSRGAPAYRENCAACHGDKLQGDRHRGIPNLADAEWLYGSGRVSEIERVVLYGIRSGHSKNWDLASMPAFANPQPYKRYKIATLLPREIDDLTAYLLAFQHKATDAAAAARGAQLYAGTERGACWDCHGQDARGDTAIGAPDLTDGHWLLGDGTQQSIHDVIAFGMAGSCPAWIAKLPPATIRSLAVYVAAAARRNSPADSQSEQRPASK